MEIVFTFRNTHDAMRGEEVLCEGGVDVRVMPLPSCLGAGCGMCLRIDANRLQYANELLAKENVSPQGIHRKSAEHGRVVYVEL